MGEGTVDWDESFAVLAEQGWRGRMIDGSLPHWYPTRLARPNILDVDRDHVAPPGLEFGHGVKLLAGGRHGHREC
jgi:sugar phosphate isomerase/epimerase